MCGEKFELSENNSESFSSSPLTTPTPPAREPEVARESATARRPEARTN